MRRGYGVVFDRTLNVATGVLVVIAAYFIFSERFLPLFERHPVRVPEGGAILDSFTFRPLDAPRYKTSAYRHIPDARQVLLLFFDSTCAACYANLPAWREAIEAAGDETAVLAVALERDRAAAEAYARANLPGALPVQSLETRELLGTLGVDIVPFTALVGTDGALLFARPGRLGQLGLADLEKALGRPSGPNIIEEE